MTTLSRYNPLLREFASLADMMNRFIESTYDYESAGGSTRPKIWLPVDAYSTENEFVILAHVPGVKPEDVDITVEGTELTIRGEFVAPYQENLENVQYLLHECRYGPFERRLNFNVPIDTEHIEAFFENGVLRLTVPKAETVRPKHIKINVK
jgi:HSP20 family protein